MKTSVDISAIKERKRFLEKELNYINGLIDLYDDGSDSKDNKDIKDNTTTTEKVDSIISTKRNTLKRASRSFNDYVLDVINKNDELSVSEIYDKIIEIYPNKGKYEKQDLLTKIRTSVWSNKNKGILNSRDIGNNKFVYSIKKKTNNLIKMV
jgi:hypothetical protein